MKLEVYIDQYKFEWEQRSYLMSFTNLSIMLVTIIAGALVTVSRLYSFTGSNASYFIGGLLVLSLIVLAFAAISIFRSMIGYQYERIPRPNSLSKWRNELEAWHTKYGDIDKVDDEFNDVFLKFLGDAVETNATNNKTKSAHVYRANLSAGIAAAFLFVPAASFVFQGDGTDENVQLVEIVGGNIKIVGDSAMSQDENETTVAEPEPEPSPPPPKPEPPSNELIKEHTVIPNTRTDESD